MLLDVKLHRRQLALRGHTKRVSSTCFHPTGKILASGSDDRTISFWDVKTGRVQATFRGHTRPVRCVSFSPEGQALSRQVRMGPSNSGM
ncbi:MAG: WD40 repeat domain-containing protein [Gemmataceae bacterium]